MRGILLVNLGTPDAPSTGAVRRYLREFLTDGRVIDLNPIARRLLVEGAILPFRPKLSAHAYSKIWTEQGSPLLLHGLALRDAVRSALGPDVAVELGMRYGNPSIPSALGSLRQAGANRIVVAPLYPQYSSAATGSSLEATFRELSRWQAIPAISVLPPFYDDPGYLEAVAAQGRPVLAQERPDHVLFSFHGLPERQVRAADPSGAHCLASEGCCGAIGKTNQDCYRAHCFATARSLAAILGLEAARWSTAFQSRLGRTVWIRPYIDDEVPRLVAAGVKRLVVFSPAFVADCLETIEELGLRLRERFLDLGGESFALVPSLNATGPWVAALVALLRRQGVQG